jgi:diadenosine tetraphosphatase ApaH/serine/threonine PP2A family protein phosphatase
LLFLIFILYKIIEAMNLPLAERILNQIFHDPYKIVCESSIKELCSAFREICLAEPTLVHVSTSVVVVGDLHGNIEDLLEIYFRYFDPGQRTFVFLGDYVDRGTNSVHVYCFLMCLKIAFPANVVLLRGNHEFEEVCRGYGFKDECLKKYKTCKPKCSENDDDVYTLITNTFPCLALAAIVQKKYFLVHGGLCKDLHKVEQIDFAKKDLNSFMNQHNKIVEGLVWSDPRDIECLTAPSTRGAGEYFSYDKIHAFLRENNLTCIIRAHEFCQFGYNSFLAEHEILSTDTHTIILNPICLTIFSATDYYDDETNDGAVALITNTGDITIEILESAKAKYRGKKPVHIYFNVE